MLNEYDCPLLELSKRIFTTSCHSIKSPVSLVHECGTSCVVQEGSSAESMEREEVVVSNGLVLSHDWTNRLYCYNVFCV